MRLGKESKMGGDTHPTFPTYREGPKECWEPKMKNGGEPPHPTFPSFLQERRRGYADSGLCYRILDAGSYS